MTDENKGKKRRRRRRRKPDGEAASRQPADDQKRPRGPRKGKSQAGSGADTGGKRRRRRRSAAGDAAAPNPAGEPQPRPPRAVEAASPLRVESASDAFVPDSEDGEVAPIAALAPLHPVVDDPDPSTSDDSGEFTREPVADLVGIRFRTTGKTFLFDSSGFWLDPGEEVVVEADGGPRIGKVAVATARRTHRQRRLKRVLRRPNTDDRERQQRSLQRNADALSKARESARRLGLPIKVFRCEVSGRGDKVTVFFSSEEKLNAKALVHDLSKQLACRIDTRQTGVRDAAKAIGGIGSCGEELCCTKWLPAFVPVSIKHAKDQGLALNPQKISGQCGRLKCCLVYEHAAYAELRKGLPRLGKRVVTEDGEGRVVEVDVLRQRIRVSLQGGDNKVYGAGEVEPMFPSQHQDNPKRK